MKPRPKQLPRLWCALQGLLPFDACIAAQQGELAWPRDQQATSTPVEKKDKPAARERTARS